MSFSASSAVSSSRAATAATGSPTKRTLSRASACSSWLTGRMPKGMGSSLPTRVARTPGCAAARETSPARVLAQQLLRHEQEARRAVAALRGAQLGEGLLQGMQDAIAGQALHGRHVTALAFDGQGQAGQHGPAVHEHGAGPALSELAAVLGA